ncbi:hypothetical protein C2G38_2216873 [Gigaspora rosea]|uniref:Uncharacterized protein n=1 Tax=Gigaspora rosea TaxID=44941 RepID=A0A397UBN1_9GLOM|nr:hypothetical protein C2G38_2216873 [Gigaspora rosea]
MIVNEFHAFEERARDAYWKISAIGIDNVILYEIHKFLFPVQEMIVDEFRAFEERPDLRYINHELVDIIMSDRTDAERAAENRHKAINELIERACDAYWKVEEKGDSEQTNAFIKELKICLDLVLNNQMLV